MNRRRMMTTLAGGVVAAGYAGRANAAPAADGKLPVGSADAAKDFPGAKELPDPKTDYKVVFSVGAKVKDDEVHPMLKMIGLYLNTLAHNGVPAKNRHIAAMFHQGGGDAVFANDVYKARHNGVDNPNIAARWRFFAGTLLCASVLRYSPIAFSIGCTSSSFTFADTENTTL